jgi:hypothetical protein
VPQLIDARALPPFASRAASFWRFFNLFLAMFFLFFILL